MDSNGSIETQHKNTNAAFKFSLAYSAYVLKQIFWIQLSHLRERRDEKEK